MINTAGDYFYTGTSTGELCIFNVPNKVFKAALPISNNGILSFAYTEGILYVGSGDGRLKKLVGGDGKWNLEAEIILEGKVVSISLSPNKNELLVGT